MLSAQVLPLRAVSGSALGKEEAVGALHFLQGAFVGGWASAEWEQQPQEQLSKGQM